MQLSDIAEADLPFVLDAFVRRLKDDPWARRMFGRIAASRALMSGGVDLPVHRARAVALAHAFGIATIDEPPALSYSWDGAAIRVDSEASVIVHEVAHWLLCSPARRVLPDFGLGAGPETGRVADADARAAVDPFERMEEEALASLLGILWEVELGLPAILAFLEQNWLEGYERPAAAEHFVAMLRRLRERGLIDADGRPVGPADAAPCRERVLAREGAEGV